MCSLLSLAISFEDLPNVPIEDFTGEPKQTVGKMGKNFMRNAELRCFARGADEIRRR